MEYGGCFRRGLPVVQIIDLRNDIPNVFGMEITFSIIIPHKNTPDLLQRCLDSIPVRDDIQVIVVDDNSDAEKVDFEHFPRWNGDNYECILTKEGKGGGFARNIGLKHAKGTWVLFSDADDFFTSDFQRALDEITDDSPDITFFNATSIRINDSSHSHRVDHLNQMHMLYDKDPKKASLQFRFLFGEPWCKIIRRELISSRQICFDEIPIHNDTLFSYMVGYYAKSIGVNHSIVYCVTDSQGSVSKNQATSVQYVRTMVFAEKNRFLYEHGIPMFDHYLLKPIFDCATKKDWKCMIRCLFIARRYGFPVIGTLLRVKAPNRLKLLIRFGIAKYFKFSYDV